jgi:hypothetical protein
MTYKIGSVCGIDGDVYNLVAYNKANRYDRYYKDRYPEFDNIWEMLDFINLNFDKIIPTMSYYCADKKSIWFLLKSWTWIKVFPNEHYVYFRIMNMGTPKEKIFEKSIDFTKAVDLLREHSNFTNKD